MPENEVFPRGEIAAQQRWQKAQCRDAARRARLLNQRYTLCASCNSGGMLSVMAQHPGHLTMTDVMQDGEKYIVLLQLVILSGLP